MKDLRQDFFKQLLEIAKKDNKIHCLVGDLGYSFKEEFEKELPEQITNVGIAEQNMVGMAAGMAIAGLKPFVYSNALFITSRANEQVRNDVCYNNLNVKLVGTGAAGFLGFSHNCNPYNEDELLIRHFPNIKLFRPKNEKELKEAMLNDSPTYIRI